MNRNEEFEQLIREYRDIPVPQSASDAVKDAIERGCAQAAKRRRMVYIGGAFGTCAAAALVLLFIWLAPGKGRLIRSERKNDAAGDVRRNSDDPMANYSGTTKDGLNDGAVGIAEITDSGAADDSPGVGFFMAGSGADGLMTEENCVVKALEYFEEEMTQRQLEVTLAESKVLTNNTTWFTLAVYARENGNENQEIRGYYNIDKASGELVTLAQLFGGADNLSVIQEEIFRQMKETQTANAGNETEKTESEPVISENQNYYFNDTEELVIVLEAEGTQEDEPASDAPADADTGYREFVIPTALLP